MPAPADSLQASNAADAQEQRVPNRLARVALAVLRLGFGFTFLWAFFDKLLALGLSTGRADGSVDYFGSAAWINGGSPTDGYLSHAVSDDNPFHSVFTTIAGAWWVDWLFMIGLFGIGVALLLGIAMRIAAVTGAILYVLMWLASWPLETNPVIDDHLLGAISVIVLAVSLAGDTWGLGKAWARRPLVRANGFLR